MSVSQSTCPRGARVSIVAFSARTKYLLRFSDYSGKEQLLQAVRNIGLERTASRRRLGEAMRFVGHHVLKRVRSAHTLQKVALFFSNGPTQDPEELVTAVMELRANNIVPVVMSLRTAPNVETALKVDDSGKSIFSVLSRNKEETLKKIKNCALCNDPCSPSPSCSFQDRPVSVDLDLALVLDGSREVPQDQFQGFQELLGSVVSQVSLSPSPQRPGPGQVRVGLVQMSGNSPTLEFGLDQYQNQVQVQDHLLHKVQQKRGSSALGLTLDFTLRQLLLRSGSPPRQKLLLLVLGTQSVSLRDRSRLDFVSQQALCEGVAVAVVTVGAGPNRTQVERLASPPVPQHLVQLVDLKGDQRDYTARFLRVLLSMITKRVNSYPPPAVQRSCGQFTGQTGQGPVIVDDQEVFEEAQERFQEHTGPGQVQTGLGQTSLGQVDLVHTWTRGDGQTFETTAQSNALCALAVDSGVQCGNPVRRWYFAAAFGACAPFWFGGCGGNANSFSTEHECLRTCERKCIRSNLQCTSNAPATHQIVPPPDHQLTCSPTSTTTRPSANLLTN
ncbi:unnamed protein product [Knipowitschia caucasica]|uniref:Uncharacterized protein n=1 Tax=Knipowitschia caucasica TaxID=637954 RepID=A0AAV2MEV3_KNICA